MGGRYQQAPRAKATKGVWCMACKGRFHPECYAVNHCLASFDELVPVCQPGKKKSPTGSTSKASRKRKVTDDEEDEGEDEEEEDHDDY